MRVHDPDRRMRHSILREEAAALRSQSGGVVRGFGNNPFLYRFSLAWRITAKAIDSFPAMGSRRRKNYTDDFRLILIDDYTVDHAGLAFDVIIQVDRRTTFN
jgi:hypothetical protein